MAKLNVKHCSGCSNDFYNGHNDLGVKECWSREDAKMGKYRLIPIDLRPPYLHIEETELPTCYSKPRYVKVKAEALDAKGYWRK